MRLAVMQPYFFPYIGYFQLVQSVDTFVFFNDVNFIKKGWINRNSILHQHNAQPFVIPLVKASQNKRINETAVSDFASWRTDFLHTLEFNYRKAPYFKSAYELIHALLHSKEDFMIDELAAKSVIAVAAYIGLKTKFLFSSDFTYSGTGGQEKILDICRQLNASVYINPRNGAHQYNREVFADAGVELLFLQAVNMPYKQFSNDHFLPWLSVIDVLMFNAPEAIAEMVGQNQLLTEVPE